MKKIIHFSDLHVGYKDLGERFNCICNNLIFEKEPAADYIVVITGDLVDSALEPAYFREAKMCIEKLEKSGFKVLVVPGNHDYGNGAYGRKKYVDQFKEVFFGTTDIEYPKLDIIENIAFMGLDSMAEELNWTDRLFAQGELGNKQLKRLEKILASTEVAACKYRVVYLHHHPFDPRFLRELKDSDELGAVLQVNGKIDALLYGHNHHGKKRNGKWDIPRCYDAGSTTSKQNAPAYHRVIDLDRDARWDYDADLRCVF